MDIFNLEYRYKLFLERVGLNEKTMHPQQKLQLKQSFYAACGQMLQRCDYLTFQTQISIENLDQMMKHFNTYFFNEVNSQN